MLSWNPIATIKVLIRKTEKVGMEMTKDQRRNKMNLRTR
jgi:hypothetical protein